MSPVTYKEKVMSLSNETISSGTDHDNCFLCGGPNRCEDFGRFVMIHCPNEDCSNHEVMTIPVLPAERHHVVHDVNVYQRKFRFV